MNKEIGGLLTKVRETAGLTQRQVANRMRANQTRVSRIEAGEAGSDDITSFLEAIESESARSLLQLLSFEWRHLPRPSLRHPDLDVLMDIEGALARVRGFLDDDQVPTVLAGQAELVERRLYEAGAYLLALEHEIVYVGDIGVGKTTAGCAQTGLVVDPDSPADLKGMLLDTGGGRTTLCDVRVETGERWSLAVDPVPDEEVYKLVAEVTRGIQQRLAGGTTAPPVDFTPAEEIERALRNMAKLPRPPRPRKGAPARPDPAMELARQFTNPEDFVAEFASRLSLWRRSRRVIDFDGADSRAARQWLRTTFTAINNGRQDDFSLPAKITVTVPFGLIPDSRFVVAIVDTRGVDGSAVRPDILAHLKDERAVVLLCSKWGSAPDPSAQNLLTYVGETGADPLLLNRVTVVALARTGDALSMRHDSGESPQDIADGYDIKLAHVEDALQRIGILGVSVYAFDASTDEPKNFSGFLIERISSVRRIRANAARDTINALEQMLENRQQAQALAAMRTVAGNLERFVARNHSLRGARRPAHDRLISAVTSLHARTVWAATRRAGRFWNFDVFQHLGDGAAAESKIRSAEVIAGLGAIIESDQSNPELVSTQTFLAQILANMTLWEADFLNAARHHAVAVYNEPLTRAQDLWDRCEADYGTSVGGYRDGVAAELRTWFEENVELREELERRIGRAWETSVIVPLRRAAGLAAGP